MYIAGANRAVDTGDTYFNELGTSLSKQVLRIRELIKQKPFSDKPPLQAKINYGRWVIECPNCNNAEFAFEDRLFFCTQCNNGNGELRKVILPTKRKQIEKVLGKRLIVNRHWKSGETIDSLIAENKEHGVEEAL